LRLEQLQSWGLQVQLFLVPVSRSKHADFIAGKQGRGVIDALLFSMGPVQFDVRPMSRSLTSKLAQRFTQDFPQLSLVKWQEEDTESLRQCFEGCYGAFIITNPLIRTDLALRELTRTEIELGRRCLEAAKVNCCFSLLFQK
jgi:NmrA-like family